MVNFSQIPVTNEVKLKQNFDLLSNLLIGTSGIGFKTILWALFRSYFGPSILQSVAMAVSSIVNFYIALSNGPSCLHKLDSARKTKMTKPKTDT